MSIPATQLRPGMIIKHNNDLHSVFSVEHRTPGNLRAFIQAKLRNLRTGAMFEHRFRSPDPIEKINVDEVEMQFLYSDGDSYYFMDTTNYEQTHLTKDILGDAVVACQQAGQAPKGDATGLVLLAWSAVHGFATLWVDRALPFEGLAPERLAPEIGSLVALMFSGLARSA